MKEKKFRIVKGKDGKWEIWSERAGIFGWVRFVSALRSEYLEDVVIFILKVMRDNSVSKFEIKILH